MTAQPVIANPLLALCMTQELDAILPLLDEFLEKGARDMARGLAQPVRGTPLEHGVVAVEKWWGRRSMVPGEQDPCPDCGQTLAGEGGVQWLARLHRRGCSRIEGAQCS